MDFAIKVALEKLYSPAPSASTITWYLRKLFNGPPS
jgi:hypothetical protein